MHIHGVNPNATNLYSAVTDEKAAAAKQAAEVRKKLLSRASEIEGDAESESQATSLIGAENEEHPPPDHNQNDSLAARKRDAKNPSSDRKEDAEDDSSDDPVSVWG